MGNPLLSYDGRQHILRSRSAGETTVPPHTPVKETKSMTTESEKHPKGGRFDTRGCKNTMKAVVTREVKKLMRPPDGNT
jgi:hypothetical protein